MYQDTAHIFTFGFSVESFIFEMTDDGMAQVLSPSELRILLTKEFEGLGCNLLENLMLLTEKSWEVNKASSNPRWILLPDDLYKSAIHP